MGLTSLQVCMDSSDWLQGTIHEGTGNDSSSSPSEDILTCAAKPLVERRMRPPHDQAQKCPRCDSTNTKFCYYNNYSLTQPRYFCKSCRRYWTKGGTLRNIPVGGGCRKNKKVSSKKSNDHHHQQATNQNVGSSSTNPTDLQLSYPDMQFSHLSNFLGHSGSQERIYSDDRVFSQMKVSESVTRSLSSPNFVDTKYNLMLENQVTPIDFMESKYEALVGNGELGMIGGLSDMNIQGLTTNFPGICSPFGMALDVNNNGINHMDTYHQRLMLPYESQEDQNALDVKPNTKALSLDWHDQACSDAGKDTFGYLGGLGSWTGLMNSYGTSATNPLV